MDQHLHHPQQWHPRPIQGTFCPICAMPHFPFCPPHPSFNPNPRYPFGHDPYFHRPGFEPHRSLMGVPRPSMGNLDDGLADQRPWIRNSGNSYDHVSFQPHRESFLPPPYEYGGDGFVNDAERSYKRPRVDDVASDGVIHELNQNQKSGRSSFEDELRLKLIRDHGVVSSGYGDLEEVGSPRNLEINSFQDSGNDNNDGMSQHFHDEGNLASAKQFQNGREGFWSDLKHSSEEPGNRIDTRLHSQNEEFSQSRYDQVGGHWHSQHLHCDYRPSPCFEMNPIHMRPFSSHGNAHSGTRNFNGSSIEGSRFFIPVSTSAITSSAFSSVPEHRSFHHLLPMPHVSTSPMMEVQRI